MKGKFILLRVFAAVVMMLCVGNANGQTQSEYHWDYVWYHSPNSYRTQYCNPSWTYVDSTACGGIHIAGNAHWSFYRWNYSLPNGSWTLPGGGTCSSGSTNYNGNTKQEYRWTISGTTLSWHLYKYTCSCSGPDVYGDYSCGWDSGVSQSSGSSTPNPGTGTTWNGGTSYTVHSHPSKIEVTAAGDGSMICAYGGDSYTLFGGVFSGFYWDIPVWTHYFYYYSVGGSGTTTAPYVSGPTEETTYPSPQTGTVPVSDITTKGVIRLTANQPFSEANNATGTLINNATSFYFDGTWNGYFGTASNNATISGWDMKTIPVGYTLGFKNGYTGTGSPSSGQGGRVAAEAGTLLLGSSCVTQNIDVKSTANVLVNAYNIGAPNGKQSSANCLPVCGAPGADNVTYNFNAGLTTNIAANLLQITNTNGGCYAVNFGCTGTTNVFTPTFSGNGTLYINPNVTNFNGGANFQVGSNTGDVRIYSTKITNTGPFTYASSGSGSLHVKIRQPQNGSCGTCGFFNVTGNLTTTNTGSGDILINDTILPINDGVSGSFSVGGTYTHTGGSNNRLHSVYMDLNIVITGATLFDAKKDDISFISVSSWIALMNTLEYKATDGASDLLISARGACNASPCSASTGGYVRINGSVSTTSVAAGTVKIESQNHYAQIDNGIAHTGVNGHFEISGNKSVNILGRHTGTPALPSGITLGAAGGGNEGVYLYRTGTGADAYDRIYSQAGHIHVTSPFTYVQTTDPGTANIGLSILATGACDATDCLPNGAIVGGYVALDSSVVTKNAGVGVVSITSTHHYVKLGHGMIHEGVNGNLTIKGDKYVDILYGYHNGTSNSSAPAALTQVPTGTGVDSIGLFILRNGTAKDTIQSEHGHIHIQQALTYDQIASSNAGSFTVLAQGNCNASECGSSSQIVGGYVKIDSAVTTTNDDGGTTTVKSENHYVEMGRGFVHRGIDGDLLVSGQTRVDIKRDYPIATGNAPFSSINRPLTPALQVSGATEGVYIYRTGTGNDDIKSPGGHVDVTNPLTYEQTQANNSGLTILAQGNQNCEPVVCSDNVGGYVWLRNDVNTTNVTTGYTTIESENHFVRLGKVPSVDDPTGGHFTHEGVDGDLNVLAGSSPLTTCFVACLPGQTEATWESALLSSFNIVRNDSTTSPKRSYVWIGDDVNITMTGQGNAVIRSYDDIVEFDDSVTFTDATGSNLWVDGLYGVRTLGPTALYNKAYDGSGTGTATGVNTSGSGYGTTGQGFVTYLSKYGFIDFGKAATISDDVTDIGGNTPFLYEATAYENALLVEGHSRVFFGDSVTIKMSTATSGTTAGNAKIYSPAGWIKFADTVGYSATDGNLLIYANGTEVRNRSCWIEDFVCDFPNGGFVLFDSITSIDYSGKGLTWIRSNTDDVVMGDMFTYTNATNDSDNGEIVIQAGQDIYGRNADQGFVDTIKITQDGERPILFEAKKTIHLEQNLYIDRTSNATLGDITLKAGYPTFSKKSVSVANGNQVIERAADYQDALPSAALTDVDWTTKGDCMSPYSYNYTNRFACLDGRPSTTGGATTGGDIWFEGRVTYNIEGTTNTIKSTTRAYNSIFIDSTYEFIQAGQAGDSILMFAETGNVEAAATRQDRSTFPTAGYIADDTVLFNISDAAFAGEIRIQAGNQVLSEGDINTQPTAFLACWATGSAPNAEYNGNILYNKPLLIDNKGIGKTLISAARDIETQVMAPFVFSYDNINADSITLTAGRHVETHAMMRFEYPTVDNTANITVQAGRLRLSDLTGYDLLCKTTEQGTTLNDGIYAYNPEVLTGGVSNTKNNSFAAGGLGQGSILVFDSMEYNYNGLGKILMVAENGNIESDPYLHKNPQYPGNPGTNLTNTLFGNAGDGYMPYVGASFANDPSQLQHDAQITFNHGGQGITQMKAIDIKLHDRLLYNVTQSAVNKRNGQFYMTAYDSILTRNLKYYNPTDTGSVFITTAKYKYVGANNDCGAYNCGASDHGIVQGHIVLGYGADCENANYQDSIIFDFNSERNNPSSIGGNVHILAGFEGFVKNKTKGLNATTPLFVNNPKDAGKAYGGNITFDYTEFWMIPGGGYAGGSTEIRTPNGNIWGKDSILYRGINGNLLIDAGLGSLDDTLGAIAWSGAICPGITENLLNTQVPDNCSDVGTWRTGNIMMKGGTLNFGLNSSTVGTGNAIFRTREGFIDTYDKMTVDSMAGDILKYAAMDDLNKGVDNNWGDVSERDFHYSAVENSGSVFFGADDNIMLNYGNSNFNYTNYGGESTAYPYYGLGFTGGPTPPLPATYYYDVNAPRPFGATQPLSAYSDQNPYYWTSYEGYIDGLCAATFNVNIDGYLWYRNPVIKWATPYHRLYRGCEGADCSGKTSECKTTANAARDLEFDFHMDAAGTTVKSGGVGIVAGNYVDLFTKFLYWGGTDGSGMGAVPEITTLHGEAVTGYGLYIKSQFSGFSASKDGNYPEKRRLTCEGCDETSSWPVGDAHPYALPEMTYVGFHDDARIHTQKQKSLIEAPVVEFFGHAELDTYTDANPSTTKITVKADSLIFHDSVIFDGIHIELKTYTTDEDQREADMRYGVVNDRGHQTANYNFYGPAIEMENRHTPVLELGYQRCNYPPKSPHVAPNVYDSPTVGGDIIVAFKHGFSLPIYNTIVANHARISFLTDSLEESTDPAKYIDAFLRADLLRIRNKVEFYNEPGNEKNRSGKFLIATPAQMDDEMVDPGIYTRHLHTEPGSELSIPGEDSLIVYPTTVVGGFGTIHENVMIKANGILAPGYASLMEGDCASPKYQGKLSIHNLLMEKDGLLRISINSNGPCVYAPDGTLITCTHVDTLFVQDTVHFFGKIPLAVLPESETLDPGCYLFMEYGDSLGVSTEYVKNLYLVNNRFNDYFFGLDFSEPGKVYLCVTTIDVPIIQRYVRIPAEVGVTTVPPAGDHYVLGNRNFSFTATYSGAPYKVTALGYYSGEVIDLDNGAKIDDGVYTYTIYQVTQPWVVSIGPDLSTASGDTGQLPFTTKRVWAYRNTVYINVDLADVVSVYNISGILNKKIDVREGLSKFTLERGVYVITLKDGEVFKIVIK
jgi:hypothetical protein